MDGKEALVSSCRMALPAVLGEGGRKDRRALYSQRKSSPCRRQLGAPAACGAGWLGSGYICRQTGRSHLGWLPPQPGRPGNKAELSCWAWRSSVFFVESDLWFGFARASPCCVDLHLLCPLLYCSRPPIHKKPQCHRFPGKGFSAPPSPPYCSPALHSYSKL